MRKSICTVQYVDVRVVPLKEERVLPGVVDRLVEFGRPV
jgi:hypothetical protein